MELPYTQARDQLHHPVQQIEVQGVMSEQKQKLNQMRAVYGFALPARMMIEREIIARSHRLGGLESSNIALQHYDNKLTEMSPKDVYGLPRHNAEVQPRARAFFEKEEFGEELISAQRKSTMLHTLAPQ